MRQESPVVFPCGNDRLIGLLHSGDESAEIGVVIVVGGPQYRVGSHRQFVLMARRLAAAGYPALRFDYRGMGDSEGARRTFVGVENDIEAAVTSLLNEHPTLKKVVVLGLCDAASAALMYSHSHADSRVAGLILLNPWVRTEAGQARAVLRHYYVKRLFQKSFWQKVLSGKWNAAESVTSLGGSVRSSVSAADSGQTGPDEDFIAPMLSGFRQFPGEILLVLSGRDLTAQEFVDLCKTDRSWRRASKQTSVTWVDFPAADHTLSSKEDLFSVCDACISWLQKIG
ncbi:MAG: hydrolase 1, exosortase A system-associated [Pseudomonadota bacterium]